MTDDWYKHSPSEPSIEIIMSPDDIIEETIEEHIDEINYEKTSMSQLLDIEDLQFKELIKHDTSCKKQQLV